MVRVLYILLRSLYKTLKYFNLTSMPPSQIFVKKVMPSKAGTILQWLLTILLPYNKGVISIDRKLCFTAIIEREIAQYFWLLLKQDMIVVDIGAASGYYTLLAAKRLKNSGKILSFEPEPRNFHRLKNSVDISGFKNIYLYQTALSDSEREEEFRQLNELGGSGGHSFAPIETFKPVKPDLISIRTTRLDKFLEKQGIREVDLVKIDVEGYELKVLRGMSKLLRSARNMGIICEIHPNHLEKLGHSVEEIVHYLRQFQFHIFYFKKGRLLPFSKNKWSRGNNSQYMPHIYAAKCSTNVPGGVNK